MQSNENISPAVVMSVAKELRKLSQEPLDGIKVLMNEEDITDVCAEIQGPGKECTHGTAPKLQQRRRRRRRQQRRRRWARAVAATAAAHATTAGALMPLL